MIRKILHPFEGRDEKKRELEEIERFLYVHPRGSDEAVLGGDLGAVPSSKPGKTLKLLVTEKMWSHTKITDVADKLLHAETLKTSWKVSPPGIKGKCTPIHRDKLLILEDSGEKLIAMVVRHIHISTQFYDIFGTNPIQPGQHASSRQQYEKKPLFHWGTVKRTEDDKGFTMELYDGKGTYQPDAFTAEEASTGLFFGEDLLLVRRCDKPAAVLHRGRFPQGVVTPAWECSVGPGIDPLIIVCLVAIYDDQKL